jgi:hypothetical protein
MAKDIATATDTAAANQRTELGIPFVHDSTVFAVTSDSVCLIAARAHATHVAKDTVPVDVVRVGPTRYFVFGTEVTIYRRRIFLYDQNFAYLTDIGL